MRRWVSSPAYELVARALSDARRASGLTQRDVAKLLKKPPSYVAKVETNVQRVDVIELVAFFRAVGAEPIESLAALVAELPDDLEI